jgi:membrane protein
MLAASALLLLGFTRDPHAQRDQSPSVDKDAHGRTAAAPSEVPLRGWKDIAWRIYRNFTEHRIMANAAGVAFYVLLAIFPAMAALVALYGLFAQPSDIAQHVDDLSGFLPGGATDVIRDQLTRISAQPNSTLSFAFLIGLAISLWSANAGIKAIFDALNVVYNETEKRSFFRLNLVSFAFTISILSFLLIAFGAIAILPLLTERIGVSAASAWVVAVAKWFLLFVAVSLVVALIYRFGPSRPQPRWTWISWGSVLAAILWLVTSVLFSWYAAHFGSFNQTYGSLGAIVGFMTWIWLSTIVILLGAELDAEIEHQTARDTTTDAAKPMGARGAYVADTLGEVS